MTKYKADVNEGKFGKTRRTYDEHAILEKEQKSIFGWDLQIKKKREKKNEKEGRKRVKRET